MSQIGEIKKKEAIIKNLEGMLDNIYEKLDLHVTINGGLSTGELIKTIDFHKFTEDSLEFMFNQINNHRCTYHGIGPFLFRDGGWYNIRERKLDVIKKLTEENMKLRKEVENFKMNTTSVLNYLAKKSENY